jgi:hypothetical protein
MRMFYTVVVTVALGCTFNTCAGQSPSSAPAQAASDAPSTATAILQPALNNLRQTIDSLKVDKWKRGSIRDEAGSNIGTIQRDLGETLPSLLNAADAAPRSVSKVLPVTRNVDAVYDVLVHVVEAARVVAPGDQVSQLQKAMDVLEKARVKLDQQVEQNAAAQEKQLIDLHSTVQTQAAQLRAAATPPPAPTCPAPAPAKKKKKPAPTAAQKPAGTAIPSSTPTTAPAKPQ